MESKENSTGDMSELPFRLDDQIAIVTGGGTGLGFGMARCLRLSGARVVITGRREDVLRSAADEIDAEATAFDVNDPSAAESFVADVTARLGPPSILVNNAGIHLKKPALETGADEFERVLRTHLTGAFALSRAVASHMIARGGGSIVFISSMTAYMGMPLVAAYSAAKSGVIGLVRTLSAEWAPKGVRVNAIAPGWIETPMVRTALDGDPERRRRVLARIQLGGLGHPDDVGWAAVYLCSPAARYLTGVILPVDGGGHASF
jgi:gluconate 5-dehydrogenase